MSAGPASFVVCSGECFRCRQMVPEVVPYNCLYRSSAITCPYQGVHSLTSSPKVLFTTRSVPRHNDSGPSPLQIYGTETYQVRSRSLVLPCFGVKFENYIKSNSLDMRLQELLKLCWYIEFVKKDHLEYFALYSKSVWKGKNEEEKEKRQKFS